MRGRTTGRLAGIAVALLLAAGMAARAQQPAGKQLVLDGFSYWRAHLQVSGEVIRFDGDKLQGHPARLDPLPADWTSPEFDDTTWVRTPGPFFSGKYEAGFQGQESVTPGLALICLRGKFAVSDPAAVSALSLDMTYRGGVVVYLNGKEVARRHLPEGPLELSTLAEDYPKEAFVRPDGEIIRHAYGDPERLPDRIALRIRKIGALSLDPKALRKGPNVLAVELHRAPYHEVATQKTKDGRLVSWGGKSYKADSVDRWATVGMTRFALTAEGDGIVSGMVRPKGFQVWNSDPLMPVYDTDFGDAGCAPLPVVIKGARNGRFQGILVAGSDAPIKGLKATVSDLRAAKGGATLPASNVTVRYQLPGIAGVEGERVPGVQNILGFDALAEEPPATVAVWKKEKKGNYPVTFGAVCPIWFTVHVPGDAAVGLFEGMCRVEAEGVAPVEVPLRVHVCSDWVLPPPAEFRTLAGFHQIPESVAMHYKTPLWSDEHFRLMGETFKWLGTVGCKTVFLHVIERTNMGNEQAILRWTRKPGATIRYQGGGDAPGAGDKPRPAIVTPETHEPDFTVMDRYLGMALHHLGRPPVVCLYAWDNYCGTWYSGGANNSHNAAPTPARVTELVDGKAVSALGPVYTNVVEAAAFWKPVAEHVEGYLKARGMESSLMIGIAHDSHPGGYVVEAWKRILPKAPWAFEGHPRASSLSSLSGSVPVGWGCTVWGARMARANNRKPGWSIAQMQNHFDRDCWRGSAGQQLLATGYLAGERNIAGEQRGFGRMNADSWPVIRNPGVRNLLSARYAESGWGACNMQMTAFVLPGPKGGISTGRLELMREGLQECEARIVIESALLDKAKVALLGPEMEKRCWGLLNRRIAALGSASGRVGTILFLGSDRQSRTRELFELAAEVDAKLKPGA